jgi:hypothetical protein
MGGGGLTAPCYSLTHPNTIKPSLCTAAMTVTVVDVVWPKTDALLDQQPLLPIAGRGAERNYGYSRRGAIATGESPSFIVQWSSGSKWLFEHSS